MATVAFLPKHDIYQAVETKQIELGPDVRNPGSGGKCFGAFIRKGNLVPTLAGVKAVQAKVYRSRFGPKELINTFVKQKVFP